MKYIILCVNVKLKDSKEFPLLEELIEKYKDKDIVFIGVSFDSKQEQWKRTLEMKEMKGIQLFAKGWNHQFGR